MQHKFNKLGYPTLRVLEENLTSDNIDSREIYWISLLNSCSQGLNCTSGGEGVRGEENGKALYTLDDYSSIVSFLAHTDMSLTEVSKELDISLHIVRQISKGISHGYLKEILPLEYSQMLLKTNRHVLVKRTKPYPDIVSPLGERFSVTNARAFAIEHNLCTSNLGLLLNNKRKSCLGWTLA